MKRVLFKVTVKSKAQARDNHSLIIEVNYPNNDSPKIEAVGSSWYRISCPLFYEVVSSDTDSKLVEIERSADYNELEIRQFAFGHAEEFDNISISILDIFKD